MTTFRIQALESFAFEWDSRSAAWRNRLSELADRRTHGRRNVPKRYSENSSWLDGSQSYSVNDKALGKSEPLPVQ
jgi:hypothetical protein